MKRKYLLGFAPCTTDTDGRVIKAQQLDDDHLEIDYFRDKELQFRYFLKLSDGEHEVYKDGSWYKKRFISAMGYRATDESIYGMLNRYYKKDNYICEQADHDIVSRACSQNVTINKRSYYSKSGLEQIENYEESYNSHLYATREDQRLTRVRNLNNSIPKLDYSKVNNYIYQSLGKEYYAIYSKEHDEYYVNCCDSFCELDKAKHKQEKECPYCGKKLTVIRRMQRIVKSTDLVILQRCDNDTSVARYCNINLVYTDEGRHVEYSEAQRVFFYTVVKKKKAKVYYNQVRKADSFCIGWITHSQYFDEGNIGGMRMPGEGLLYPEGIEDALKGTEYQELTRTFETMAADGMILEYNRMLVCNSKGYPQVLEYLYKGRFKQLLYNTSKSVSQYSWNYQGPLNLIGKNINEIFNIKDTQKINRIRDRDGGNKMVLWMQYSDYTGQKISDKTLDWLIKYRMSVNDVHDLIFTYKLPMSPEQVMNYIEKQTVCYPDYSRIEIFEEWMDYLTMAAAQGKDMADEMIYRPRELKRRHDECIETNQKLEIVKNLAANTDEQKAQAEKFREKYPEAEGILGDIKTKYEYANDEYTMIIPENLLDIVLEGHALHHCVGVTSYGSEKDNRYFDRIERRETYIAFLRRTTEPNIPFYTVEFEPNGTIRQHRSYYDEEPGIEYIRGFLKEWQQAIKKNLTKEDKELAQTSAHLRQKNIDELKKNRNTRVLKGLEEDFMEVMAG